MEVGLGTGEVGATDGVAIGTVVGVGLAVGGAVGDGELVGEGVADAMGLGLGDGLVDADGLGNAVGVGLDEGDGVGEAAATFGDGVTCVPTPNPMEGSGTNTAISGVELAIREPVGDGEDEGRTTLSFDFSKTAMLAKPLALSVPSEFTLTSRDEPCFSPVEMVPDCA